MAFRNAAQMEFTPCVLSSYLSSYLGNAVIHSASLLQNALHEAVAVTLRASGLLGYSGVSSALLDKKSGDVQQQCAGRKRKVTLICTARLWEEIWHVGCVRAPDVIYSGESPTFCCKEFCQSK